MPMLRPTLLFGWAAVAEIGGAWMVWQGAREDRGGSWVGAGVIVYAPRAA